MHIQKFSDEAMREAGPCFELGNWDAGQRILLADVNTQLAAQTDDEMQKAFLEEMKTWICFEPLHSTALNELAVRLTQVAIGRIEAVRQTAQPPAIAPAEQSPPAPDATMQRVAASITHRLAYYLNESERDGLELLADDLGLEILPAQPIRVVVKGVK